MSLDREIAEYERLLPGWLQEGRRGQWVVIKSHEIAAFFSSFDEAYREGGRRWGNTDMLVKKILPDEEEPVFTIQRVHFS